MCLPNEATTRRSIVRHISLEIPEQLDVDEMTVGPIVVVVVGVVDVVDVVVVVVVGVVDVVVDVVVVGSARHP